MFGHNPQRTGHSLVKGTVQNTIKWKYKTGDDIDSSPAVAGGTVYVGSSDDYLYAVDASTGKLKWKSNLVNITESSPVVTEGRVYIGASVHLYAVDASTGKLKWKYKIGGGWVESSPAVAGGTVYVGSKNSYLYAVDASTGKLKWKYKTGDDIESSPAVAGGTVYVGSWDSYLYAVDASTGKLKWKYKTGHFVNSSPAVMNGTVYVGSSDDHLRAIDASTGKLEWRDKIGENVSYRLGSFSSSSPAVDGETVYIGSSDANSYDHMFALDAFTGRLEWKYRTGGWVNSSPAIGPDGTVYVGSDDDYLYAFGKASENIKYKVSTEIIPPESASLSFTPPSGPYKKNTEVTIVAKPNNGYKFVHWKGDYPSGQRNNSNITITLDSNKSLKAKFVKTQNLLPSKLELVENKPERWINFKLKDKNTLTVEDNLQNLAEYLKIELKPSRAETVQYKVAFNRPGSYLDYIEKFSAFKFESAESALRAYKDRIEWARNKTWLPGPRKALKYTTTKGENNLATIEGFTPETGGFGKYQAMARSGKYLFIAGTDDFPDYVSFEHRFQVMAKHTGYLLDRYQTVKESAKDVLVVPTRYPDESSWPEERIVKFNKNLKYLSEYFSEQSFGTDSIDWKVIKKPIPMPQKSGAYGDSLASSFDSSYSPSPKYPNDLKKILKDEGFDLSQYESLLAFQSYAASRANGFSKNFRSVTYNPDIYPPGIEDIQKIKYDGVPIAVVPYDENNVTIAHELGHSIYNLKDYYEKKIFGLIPYSGDIHGWGLMGYRINSLDRGPEVNLPLFSINKVRIGWLNWREKTIRSGSSQFKFESLEKMEEEDEVLKIHRNWPLSVSYIVEGRENSYRDYHSPGWMKSIIGTDRGVVIYRKTPPLYLWKKLNPTLKAFKNWTPTLFRSSKIKNQTTYADPLTFTVFRYKKYEKESEKHVVEVRVDPGYFAGMVGKTLTDFSLEGITEITQEAPEGRASYPGLDLHAYDFKGRHVGMNYETGEYEVEIPGAMASGPKMQEWILGPDNIDVTYKVSSERVKEYLENIGASTENNLEYSTRSISYGRNPSIKVVENKVRFSDVMFTKAENHEIEPGKTKKIIPAFHLTASVQGKGSVKLTPDQDSYKKGTKVKVTADPASGYEFDRWSGDISGTSETKTVTVTSDMNVTAHFTETGGEPEGGEGGGLPMTWIAVGVGVIAALIVGVTIGKKS